jgi:tripartite-type tricarboxylate transporter receptor subunit TctC
VAYRGTGPALNDLIGGHVDFFCEQAVSVAPQIAAGTIKAYGAWPCCPTCRRRRKPVSTIG